MRTRVYLYSTDENWNPSFASYCKTDEFTGYHEAAAQIVREYDNRFCDYPDERFIWVQDEKHDTPRRFRVDAESVRQYSAREVEPLALAAKEDEK